MLIFATSASQRAVAALSVGLKGLTTSAAIKNGSSSTSTYTSASPGSSIHEPGYEASSSGVDGGDSKQEAAMPEVAGRVTPSKKASMLKGLVNSRKRKLTVQGAGVQMLPPGCSISDPSYSIKDPVYFADVEK